MFDIEKLYNLKSKHNEGFGCDLGNGYACFITKLIEGDWMISKLDKKDKDVFRKIIPGDSDEKAFKECLQDMLNTY